MHVPPSPRWTTRHDDSRNPRIFRRPALQTEAQSTSALEGTYAPLIEVLTADEERPPNLEVREVLNYVRMGDAAFNLIESGHQLTVSMLEQLQAILVRGTRSENENSGTLRKRQVVIGQRTSAARAALPVPGRTLCSIATGLADFEQIYKICGLDD